MSPFTTGAAGDTKAGSKRTNTSARADLFTVRGDHRTRNAGCSPYAHEAIEIQQGIEEAQAFDKKLQDLEEGRPAIRVPWKKATEQPKGWGSDIDDGVKVNILPLQTAALLRIAKVVSTKGGEEDDK